MMLVLTFLLIYSTKPLQRIMLEPNSLYEHLNISGFLHPLFGNVTILNMPLFELFLVDDFWGRSMHIGCSITWIISHHHIWIRFSSQIHNRQAFCRYYCYRENSSKDDFMSLFSGFSFNITGIFLSGRFQDSLDRSQWHKSLKRVQNLVLCAKWTMQEFQMHLNAETEALKEELGATGTNSILDSRLQQN
ncbi:hypothetical protein Cgig2_015686 [Carnegiea gigantea]|uniref:Uncharacterized protein n=1 Tax=Carnegiea gigantea TaxID=171969 RepID=A0A9Q1JRV1_9CARY|nr:hypothetical protein Cgig2_015686 [Carnegiea gigantea]